MLEIEQGMVISSSGTPILMRQQHDITEPSHCLTDESVDAFFQNKLKTGVSPVTVTKTKSAFEHLKRWLGEDRELTAERLQAWKIFLEGSGCSKSTLQGYVKRINDYLRHCGLEAWCIPRPLRYDLQGKTFGSLTVMALAEHKKRRDLLWRCKCSCGREAEVITSQLVSGHTRSCGHCSRADYMRYRMRVAEDTSILKALTDDAVSAHSASGYTGVYRRRDKWIAVIIYKKKRYFLGTYSKVEEAANARARAKDAIAADGERMEREYAHLFAQRPVRPMHQPMPPRPEAKPTVIAKTRTDNTSGQRGTSRHRDKWYAKIHYKGVRYHLGTYDLLEEAIAARLLAEECVRNGDIEKLKTMHTGLVM